MNVNKLAKRVSILVAVLSLTSSSASWAQSNQVPQLAPERPRFDPQVQSQPQTNPQLPPQAQSPAQPLLRPALPTLPSGQPISTPSAPLQSSPQPSPKPSGQLPDYTNKLRMTPGARISYQVHDGLDTRWKHIGDYEFTAEVEKPSKDYAYSFKWTMTPPADSSGVRSVSAEDSLASHKVSLFYPDNQNCCLIGFTNILRISDDLFKHLKRHDRTDFELDGPEAMMQHHKETVPLPHWIEPEVNEMVDVIVDEMPAQVRAIKTKTSNGWHYWVMDNPNWPIIVKADGPFRWDPPSFNAASVIGRLPSPAPVASGDGKREGKRIVDELKLHGTATSHMILFDFDSDKLKPVSRTILSAISSYLKQNSEVKLSVEGHCDNVGSAAYNMKLSLRRANSVKQYLTTSGINAARMKANGFGFSKPIASNKTAAGRAQNRRVVFKQF